MAVVQVDKTAQEGNLWLVEFSAKELGYGIGIQMEDSPEAENKQKSSSPTYQGSSKN